MLLIDDDISTNIYHEIIIDASNLVDHVMVCSSVDEAIDLLQSLSSPPDLILLDINMPGKNGWDFLTIYKEFSASQKANKLYILSTSNHPSDLDKAKGYTEVDAFYSKPLTVDVLQTAFPVRSHQVT